MGHAKIEMCAAVSGRTCRNEAADILVARPPSNLPDGPDGEEEWQVEEIVESQKTGRETKLLVKWRGGGGYCDGLPPRQEPSPWRQVFVAGTPISVSSVVVCVKVAVSFFFQQTPLLLPDMDVGRAKEWPILPSHPTYQRPNSCSECIINSTRWCADAIKFKIPSCSGSSGMAIDTGAELSVCVCALLPH